MAKIVLTGGATGIGAAIRHRLTANGNDVLVVDIKDADISADLSSAEGRAAAIDAIVKTSADGVDGLICCAGVGSHTANKAMIPAVNYHGSIEIVEGLRPLLCESRGSVILISSNSAPSCSETAYVNALLDNQSETVAQCLETISGHDAYAGSKQAVARWMRRNAPAMAAEGIRINAIAPGYVETPMTASVANDPTYGDAIRQFVQSIPAGRPGTPDDVANLVEFLLDERAGFIVGSLLFIDGGHDAMFRADSI